MSGQAGSEYGKEALDLGDVRVLLDKLGTEAGTIANWARKRGIHPEIAYQVVRGDRPPAAKLLKAMGMERVVLYRARRDRDRSGEADKTGTGLAEGESPGRETASPHTSPPSSPQAG